jgi:hypothetical protein
MQWTSYLPSSPESLSRLEWWLWLLAGCFTVIVVLLGFAARGVAQYKARILQMQLTSALEERDSKTKQLQTLAEEAKQKAIEIEAKQAPRRLSENQKEIMVQRLREIKGARIRITTILGNTESVVYGQDFALALQAAGWHVEGGGINQSVFTGKIPVGLNLIIKDPNNPPPGSLALDDLLMQLGIKYNDFRDPSIPPDVIVMIVGSRE